MNLFNKLLHKEPVVYDTIYGFAFLFVIIAALWVIVGLIALVSWLSSKGDPGMLVFGILGIGLVCLIWWLIRSVIKYRSNNDK